MNRFKEIKGIIAHKKAFMKVRRENFYLKSHISILRALNHDTVKMFTTLILGDKIATKIHRKFSGHHIRKTYKQKVEAYCDWECARFTKPDKPLNAFQTWQTYYPDESMYRINELFNQ